MPGVAGLRIALGAQRGAVHRLVLRQGARIVLIGVGIGTGLATLATKALASILYSAPGPEFLAFGGAAGLLGAAALFASWVPARRAAKIDPVSALRAD